MTAPKATVRVKPLEWSSSPQYEKNEYGEDVFGEFDSDSIVATCSTIYCGIYRHADDKYMWVDGTTDNIRYSRYRKPPLFEKVEIPWLPTIEAAKAAAQADYEARILSAIEVNDRADVVDEVVQAAEQLRALDEDEHEAIVGLQSYRNLRAALARYRGGAE